MAWFMLSPQCYVSGMTVISQRQLRNDSGKVLREVENGASYDISVSGRVVARIVPARPRGPQRWVSPAVAREITPMAARDAAAWSKDIDEAFNDQMDDDPWASAAERAR